MFDCKTCQVNNNSRSAASYAPETFTCAKNSLIMGDATVVASFSFILALVLFAVVGMWLAMRLLNLIPVLALIITFIINLCHTSLANRTSGFTALTR